MTDKTVEAEIFSLPAVNMERLIKEVTKLNKRADKLGFPHMNINVVEKYEVIHPKYRDRDDMKDEHKPRIKMMDVTLEGEAPKIEGFEFVGTLDHYSIPGGVIVRTVPGQAVPEKFHDRDATCDHCGKQRYRTETFVLHELETGNHLCVGRQCVRDFIGYDVSGLARYLERWSTLTASFSDDGDERWWGGRIINTYQKEAVLAATFGTIRVRGWKPKSACNFEDGDIPTSALVQLFFEPPRFTGKYAAEERAAHEKFVKEVNETHEEDLKRAVLAIAWLDEQQDRNEYMHNLKVIRNADGVPLNMFGFWCSLAAAYERAMNTLEIKKAEKAARVNEWVGDIKERLEFTVKVVSINVVDGYYGPVKIHRMVDEQGRTLIWFANTHTDMERNNTYKIKGTVKKHDEYEGWKQTHLSRVSVLTEAEE